MKIRMFIAGLLLVFLLVACQGKSTNVPIVEPTPTPGAYPDMSQTQSQGSAQDSGSGTYPDPQEGEVLFWERATYYIQNGQIEKIITTSAPSLTLVMKDGRTLYTIEPSEGALDDLLKQCGEPCKSITVE